MENDLSIRVFLLCKMSLIFIALVGLDKLYVFDGYDKQISKVSMVLSSSFMLESLRSHRLQPTRLFCPWCFSGKSTGVGCHCLLWKQGNYR